MLADLLVLFGPHFLREVTQSDIFKAFWAVHGAELYPLGVSQYKPAFGRNTIAFLLLTFGSLPRTNASLRELGLAGTRVCPDTDDGQEILHMTEQILGKDPAPLPVLAAHSCGEHGIVRFAE